MLYSIDSKTGSVREQLNKTLFSVCAEGGELLWLGGRDFIVSYDWNTHISKVYQIVLNGLNYSAITVSIDKEKWIGSNKGVTQYNGISWINSAPSGWVYNDSENDDKVYALIPDSDGSIWAGTTKGLYKIQSQPLSVHESSYPSIIILNISPNPFNASTSITFTLPMSTRAELAVYSVTGQRIRTLAAGPMAAGTHTVIWDGRDDSGRAVSSGVYISRLAAGNSTVSGKMLLMK
jgi:hypothetical protein